MSHFQSFSLSGLLITSVLVCGNTELHAADKKKEQKAGSAKELKSQKMKRAKISNKPYSLAKKNKSGKVKRRSGSIRGARWGYKGEVGPYYWGDIKPEYRLCKTGSQQSPIDIRTPHKTQLPRIIHDYKPSVISMINNGNTVQYNYSPGQSKDHKGRNAMVKPSTVNIKGKKYKLMQFHFHSPSEHHVTGKSYPMEVQLLHQDKQGKIMIIGVFLTLGKKNQFLQTLWTHLPKEVEAKTQIPHAYVNIEGLLPKNRHYYNYMGSLSEPPCTEQVVWNIYAEPVEISQEQLDRFRSLYKGNARPIQARNERYILRN